MPVIGILAPNPKVLATLTVERDLAALGWTAGRNLHLVLRASAGTNEALPALAADQNGSVSDRARACQASGRDRGHGELGASRAD